MNAARVRNSVLGLTFVVMLAACGSSASMSASQSTSNPPSSGRVATSVDVISASTRMICADEAEEEISAALGIEPMQPLVPVWRDHRYSCNYEYATGVLRLSVKQLPDAGATHRYLQTLATQLGKRQVLDGLGEEAFTTTNNSVVVNKDNKVLVVDVHDLPAEFGKPADTRANAGITVAATIMGCWAEA